MRFTLILFFSIVFCSVNSQTLHAQEKKRKKIKPVYHGKLQGGYLIDKVIPEGASSFTYFNFGIRKVTGEKVTESGIETFYYQDTFGEERINGFYSRGNEQTGFGLKYYYYLKVKNWRFGKINIQVGPQFSFGYYHNNVQPFNSNNFAKTFNDFKIGASARVELNYKIDNRYSAILGTQYTIAQFGLRRINSNNPALDIRSRLDDFLQFDFLVNRYLAYFGILRQFGKVKVDRVKLKEKRAKEKLKKQEKRDKKLAKKQKKKDKEQAKNSAKKSRKKAKEKAKNDRKRIFVNWSHDSKKYVFQKTKVNGLFLL